MANLLATWDAGLEAAFSPSGFMKLIALIALFIGGAGLF
jgi:hypothetical protein